MNLDEVVKKMGIMEVGFDDGSKELHDTTLDQLIVITVTEAKTKERRQKEFKPYSPQEILKKLELGADSDKPEDKFLRERVAYWRELYSTGKILELNFGISSCSRYAPGYQWEERIMEIPLIGVLRNISDFKIQYLDPKDCEPTRFNLSNYSDVRGDKYTDLPAVDFPLAKEFTVDHKIYLVWIEQRKEWVAFNHSEWLESCNYPDERESGPYELDDYCKDMLSRAYKIPKEKVCGDISKINPSELKKIADEKAMASSGGLSLWLYDHEDADGCDRYLDITITSSQERANQLSKIILKSITLSEDEIREFVGLNEAGIMGRLFSKFGITDLHSRAGQPKGPYYYIDQDVYKALSIKNDTPVS